MLLFRLLLLVALLLALCSVGRGAPQEPLLPFKVLSVTKTNSGGKPAVAVVVRGPKGMTNDVLSAVLAQNGKILCETLGGKATSGNPCVLLCVEELKKGDYEIWLKMNPYQRDRIWPTNEADHLGKIVRIRVGDRWITIVEQKLRVSVPRKKTPAWVKAKLAAMKKPPLPPVPPR